MTSFTTLVFFRKLILLHKVVIKLERIFSQEISGGEY